MIQRIQTVYLILALLCSVLLLFFPIFELSVVSNSNVLATAEMGAYGVSGDTNNPMMLYLVFMFSALLSLLAIFLYKNRTKQLLVCRLNLIYQFIVAASFLAVYFFGFDLMMTQSDLELNADNQAKISIDVGYYLLFLGIPFLLLAIRGIRADEALLKSLDRLR